MIRRIRLRWRDRTHVPKRGTYPLNPFWPSALGAVLDREGHAPRRAA